MRHTIATSWDSVVLAASEEWVDETVFRFCVPLPDGTTYNDLVTCILCEAIQKPDLAALQRNLCRRFSITENDALTSIDRALGGVTRAASLNPKAHPDPTIDPIASSAFDQATNDHSILDAIYPDWRTWKLGYYSA